MDRTLVDTAGSLGLTDAEVADRVAAGQVNVTPEPPGRSFGQIVAANVFTVVNAIMITLFVLVLVSGNPQDGLFVGVVLSNSVIGVVQEVRARRELKRLEVVTEPRAIVIRNGEPAEIASDEIVLHDVIELTTRWTGGRRWRGTRLDRHASRRVDAHRRVPAGTQRSTTTR